VAVSFELDIDTRIVDLNPFNSAKIRLETIEAIDGDFIIAIEAYAEIQIACSFPRACTSGTETRRGKKFVPRKGRDDFPDFQVCIDEHVSTMLLIVI
jgi:hypothetical protein